MAKISTIVKNEKRKILAKKQYEKRQAYKKAMVDENLSDEERETAERKLQKLSRNGSKVRVRNRCYITGRSRGNYRKFQLSRIKFRELAVRGLVPGITKASW
jgi:small subunit ribosomal protein S14